MASKGIILIGPSTFAAFDREPVLRIERAGLVVRPNPMGRKLTSQELLPALDGVIGIVAGLEPLSSDILGRSQLKVVSRCGAGMDNVDIQAAKRLGIRVFSTPNAPTSAVAELTVGALITLMRKVPQMDQKMHQGKWEKQSGPQLGGKTVTIVGLGRIGLKVAEYLKPFGVRLLGVDPLRKGTVENIPVVSLAEALTQTDIVTIHASGSEEILGEVQLAAMKLGSYVANAGRGGLINEKALCAALETGRIAGAWLDTFAEEPYRGPLNSYPQVLLTPHIGYSSDESRRRMEMEAVDNLLAGLDL
jgi:D-3-phosphoglycerate dehydrogenase